MPWKPESFRVCFEKVKGADPAPLVDYFRNMALFIDTMYNDFASAMGRINYRAALALGDKGDATILNGQSSVVVTCASVLSTSRIFLFPVTANAAAVFGSSKHPYVSARTDNTSFTVSTGDGTNVGADAKFDYWVVAQ